VIDVPNIEIYPIDVSFQALDDAAELEYLNDLPTSFVLSGEAVDRLRAAAGRIIVNSPEFQRLVKDLGATAVPTSAISLPAAQ
jgi:NTE family protein